MKQAILASTLGALIMAGCSEPVNLVADTRQLVRVMPAEQGRLTQRFGFSAKLRPRDRAQLAFQSGGVLSSRPVRLGSVVRKGELLATLDNPELGPAQRAAAAALQEAITRRDQARRDLDRLASLRETGAVGQEAVERKQAEVDALEALRASAAARLAATRQRLEDASLVAPFDGVISAIAAEPGEYVAGGRAVLGIGGLDRVEMEVLLPASLVGQVQTGDEAEVRIPQLAGLVWGGRIAEVAAIGDLPTGLFPVVVEVEIDAQSTQVRAGMLAQAWFERRHREALIVPLAAIVDPVGGNPRVYRVSEGQVAAVPVEIIASSEARVAVLPRTAHGLGDGDLVVTEGHRTLTEGQAVRTVL